MTPEPAGPELSRNRLLPFLMASSLRLAESLGTKPVWALVCVLLENGAPSGNSPGEPWRSGEELAKVRFGKGPASA